MNYFTNLSKFFVMGLMFSSITQAASPRIERLQAQVQKLTAVESQLSTDEVHAIDYYIGGIENALSKYQSSAQLVCLSNGESGVYEKFQITDPNSGAVIGGLTTFETCKQLIASQSQNLICLSNGEAGIYEKFGPYDVVRKTQNGGVTELKTCLSLVSQATPMLMCLSNGEAGIYEKFHLWNRNLAKVLGGDTQLMQCLTSMGK
jgi:hypothetical protein